MAARVVEPAPAARPRPLRIPPPRLAGDANSDGKVDAADYVALRKRLGQTVLGGYGADFNGDRIVNSADYQLWRSNYGRSAAGQTLNPIPEPETAILSVVALVALAPMRFRSRRYFTAAFVFAR